MTPALSASPRSTCGTTRSMAYWNGSGPGMLGLLHEPLAVLQPGGEVAGVRLRLAPAVGQLARDRLQLRAVEPGRKARVGLRDRAGEGEQDVVADRREAVGRAGDRIARGVVDVERGAVVDQPQSVVPAQQVRVARGAV